MHFDSRWKGAFGIGRYAHETRSRFAQPVEDMSAPGDPVSATGIAAWEARTACSGLRRRNEFLLSPSFTPSVSWRGPQAVTVHDLIHLDIAEESSSAKRAYYEFIVKPTVRRNAVTFTVSHFSKERLVEWSGVDPERVVVTGNAVADAFSRKGPTHSAGHPYVLYVRNSKPHKNSPRLVEALARMQERDVHLYLSGEADEATVRAAVAFGVTDRVLFTGRIQDEELASYYRGALVAVLPSLYEGFGIPAIEAMACGTAVVASETTSLPEVVGDAGLLVDPLDPEAIAAALDKVVRDKSLHHRLVSAGLERSKKFSWDDITRRIETALAQAR